jgi:UDP:flavonoid glycosyltransferase YjiC (YdhE family)
VGYQVCLAAPEDFAGFIQQHGVGFYPLGGDVQQIMASDTGRKFMETGGANPVKSIRAMRTMIAPVIRRMTDDAYSACREAEALICLGVFFPFGQSIAEALRIPLVNVTPSPLLPTRAFPALGWPIQRSLGGGITTCRVWRCSRLSGCGIALLSMISGSGWGCRLVMPLIFIAN